MKFCTNIIIAVIIRKLDLAFSNDIIMFLI